MKCILIFWLFIFFAPGLSIAQVTDESIRKNNTYIDAVKLAQWYGNNELDSVKNLLERYGWKEADKVNYIIKNFLANIINPTEAAIHHNMINLTTTAELPSGSPETYAVNALATFLADRARQEIMYFLVDKLFDIANDNSKEPGKTFSQLFPSTTTVVKKLKNQGEYYYSDFSWIQQMVKVDLHDMPVNFYGCIPARQAELKKTLLVSGQLYKLAVSGGTITDMLNDLAEINPDKERFNSLFVLQVLSNALKGSHASVWLTAQELAALRADPVQLRCFIFLFFKQLQTVSGSPWSRIDTQADYDRISNTIDGLLDLATLFNHLKATLDTGDADKLALLASLVNEVTVIDRSAAALVGGRILISDNMKAKAAQLITTLHNLKDKKFEEIATTVVTYLLQNETIRPDQLRKINFFLQLANLKDEKSFEDFLKSYMDPIGRSALKRSARFNLSLNGYVGLNAGQERIRNLDISQGHKAYYGITAPVGISISFAPIRKAGSFSVFLSIIDLGSLVNARFKDNKGDTTQTNVTYSNLKFEQFLSPGVHVFFNLKGTPLSAGAYATYTNNVRDITYLPSNATAVVTATNRDVIRLGFSVLIDIPLLTFTNHPRHE
jgi:hypothetical protein